MSGFIGTGKIKVADYGGAAAFAGRKFIDIGNASAFQYSFSENKQELRDYQDPAGGTADSVSRIDTVSGQIDMRNFRADNLAMALWGTTAALNTTAITGESGYKIVPGAFIPTARLINTSIAPVVKKGATTILAADYTVSKGGITIAAAITTGTVVSGDPITIDYTPVASNDVQALINSAPNVSIFFEGVNQVDGKYTTVRIYKAKLSVAKAVDMVGDSFGTLQLDFTISKDTTVSGAGISQFLKMEVEA